MGLILKRAENFLKKNGERKKIATVVAYFHNSNYICSLLALVEYDLSNFFVIHKSHLPSF
jgi:hypothetical protein